jgi:hypothetical protein
MNPQRFWTEEKRAQLRALAATGITASEIGAIIGVTKPSVLTICGRNQIPVVMHTEAEKAEMRARERLREKRKRQKRAATRPVNAVAINVQSGTSKTAPVYRNQLPRLPEMSKNQLRDMLAEAVRNTAEMGA